MRISSVLVPVCAACVGCVDPESDFNDFAARAHTAQAGARDAGGDGGPCSVAPGTIEGQYLLAISVTLAPGKPILALAEVTTPPLDGGTGFAFDAQPLSATDRKTPVGQKASFGPFQVDENGAFRADIPNLETTGAANPVTGGDIAAHVILSGSLCGDGRFFCGAVTGNVTKPLPLDLKGSTFTLTRVDSATLPSRPAVDCVGTIADPL